MFSTQIFSPLTPEANNLEVVRQYNRLEREQHQPQLALWRGRKLFLYTYSTAYVGLAWQVQQLIRKLGYFFLSKIIDISFSSESIRPLYSEAMNTLKQIPKEDLLSQFLEDLKSLNFEKTELDLSLRTQFLQTITFFKDNLQACLSERNRVEDEENIWHLSRKAFNNENGDLKCTFYFEYIPETHVWKVYIKPTHTIKGVTIEEGGFRRAKKVYCIFSDNPHCVHKKCYKSILKSISEASTSISPFFNRIVSQLSNHPHVERVHHLFKKRHSIISDLYEGTVMQLIKKHSLSNHDLITLCLKIAKAVRALHNITITPSTPFSHRAFHADISPQNILASYNPRTGTIDPFLSDFDGAAFSTTEGAYIAKPAYISPEYKQFLAQGRLPTEQEQRDLLTHGSEFDIWSLGLTFACFIRKSHQFLSKENQPNYHPFITDFDNTLDETIEQVSGTKDRWRELLSKMIAHDPKERWDIDKVVLALEKMEQASTPLSKKIMQKITSIYHGIPLPIKLLAALTLLWAVMQLLIKWRLLHALWVCKKAIS